MVIPVSPGFRIFYMGIRFNLAYVPEVSGIAQKRIHRTDSLNEGVQLNVTNR